MNVISETSLTTKPLPPPVRTVLVVEDDDQVRKLIRTVLKRNGYQVLEAENGELALAFCSQYQGPLDLLITDLALPRVGGLELAAHLSPSFPAMRVLYVSGFTFLESEFHGIFPPGLNFLQNPFTLDQLMRKVDDMLPYAARLTPYE
jgi:DNA-binding NtrC family response regulator